MSRPYRCETEVEVRYAETDRMGVVHHSVYFVWFELARTRLCLETGFHYAEVEARGYYLVVTRTEARHLAGASYGERVGIVCWLDKLWSRGLRFGYEVRRGEKLLATGSTEHVWVARDSGRPCRIPEFLKGSFEQLYRRRAAT